MGKVKDELLNRFWHTHMSFIDFLEAIARVAEMMTLPDSHDVEAAGCMNAVEYVAKMRAWGKLEEQMRDAGSHYTDHFGQARPLSDKLEIFLQIMYSVYDQHGAGGGC